MIKSWMKYLVLAVAMIVVGYMLMAIKVTREDVEGFVAFMQVVVTKVTSVCLVVLGIRIIVMELRKFDGNLIGRTYTAIKTWFEKDGL